MNIYAKEAKKDKQREVDEWHREVLGPARRLRGGCGGRGDPAPRLGAEQQLSQPGLHEHRQSLLRSAEDLRANLLVGRRDGSQQSVCFGRQPADKKVRSQVLRTAKQTLSVLVQTGLAELLLSAEPGRGASAPAAAAA